MAGIHVYNINQEGHSDNDFYIGRPSILSNPYTHIKDKKTLAKFVVKDREEAIKRYSEYFDIMYGSNKKFTEAVDTIYSKYKSGEDVYLGCFCYPQHCHGDVIVEKLRNKLIKEKFFTR